MHHAPCLQLFTYWRICTDDLMSDCTQCCAYRNLEWAPWHWLLVVHVSVAKQSTVRVPTYSVPHCPVQVPKLGHPLNVPSAGLEGLLVHVTACNTVTRNWGWQVRRRLPQAQLATTAAKCNTCSYMGNIRVSTACGTALGMRCCLGG